MVSTLAGKSSKTLDIKRKNIETQIPRTWRKSHCCAQPILQHWWRNHLLSSIPCQETPPGPRAQACAGVMHSSQPVQQRQRMATCLYGEQRWPRLQESTSSAGLCSALHCTTSKFPCKAACQQKAWLLGREQRGDLTRKINVK